MVMSHLIARPPVSPARPRTVSSAADAMEEEDAAARRARLKAMRADADAAAASTSGAGDPSIAARKSSLPGPSLDDVPWGGGPTTTHPPRQLKSAPGPPYPPPPPARRRRSAGFANARFFPPPPPPPPTTTGGAHFAGWGGGGERGADGEAPKRRGSTTAVAAVAEATVTRTRTIRRAWSRTRGGISRVASRPRRRRRRRRSSSGRDGTRAPPPPPPAAGAAHRGEQASSVRIVRLRRLIATAHRRDYSTLRVISSAGVARYRARAGRNPRRRRPVRRKTQQSRSSTTRRFSSSSSPASQLIRPRASTRRRSITRCPPHRSRSSSRRPRPSRPRPRDASRRRRERPRRSAAVGTVDRIADRRVDAAHRSFACRGGGPHEGASVHGIPAAPRTLVASSTSEKNRPRGVSASFATPRAARPASSSRRSLTDEPTLSPLAR